MRYLITGATGFVGGHIAEEFRKRDWPVSAIVRPSSNCADLEKWGVKLYRAELTDPASAQIVRQAALEAEVVVHCAAKVGDWGPLEEYRKVNVEGLRVLLNACKDQPLHRFILMSSLGVYAARHHHGTTEEEPLPKSHRDGYSQSKVEAEQLAMSYFHDFGLPLVILRPGFVYGPRDRTVMPRIIEALRKDTIRYPGGGKRALNTVFVGNVVDAVLLAVSRDNAIGQAYNLTDGDVVSKRRFIEAVADAMELPHPNRNPPYWISWITTWLFEKVARMRGKKEAPIFNFTRLKFLGMDLDFSIDKARRELGYVPRADFSDGMYQTMAWYKERYGNR